MSYTIKNFPDGQNMSSVAEKGGYSVIEYDRDMSVSPWSAESAFFAAQMNVKRRQLVADLSQFPNGGVNVQSGAMQWMLGDVQARTGIRGAGDLVGKMFRGAVTGESAIKPEYVGGGILVLEPTYKYILLEDVRQWGGGIVIEDGSYLSSSNSLQQRAVSRSTISSAVAGGEGLFNLGFFGEGILAMESAVPREELVTVKLDNDVLKIDGPMAVAWSPQLQFTVERTTRTLIGSAASGEGLVNVYRGTGKVMFAPVRGAGAGGSAASTGSSVVISG